MAQDIAETLDPTGVIASHRTLSTGKRNFDALTGLRFFAAIGVVFYHFAQQAKTSWPAPLANLVDSGFVAVSFFYVLSGFVLSYSYVNSQGQMQGSRRSFWVARLARIYPAYLLAFLLATPTNIIWSLHVNHLGTAIAKLFVGAVSVLSLQQAWTPWSAWYWNYPAWSVSVEAFFYLVFPFLALGLRRFQIRTAFVGIACLWLLSLIAPVALILTNGVAAGPGDRLEMAVEFTPLLRLPEFAAGLLLGRIYVQGFRLSFSSARIATYLSAVAILGILAVASPSIPRPLLAGGLLVPLFALLILALAEGQTLMAKALAWAPLILLGEASYGIYILQIPVSYVLRSPPPLQSLVSLSFYSVVLIVTALLSWRFVEAPLRVQIRRRLLGRDSGSSKRPPHTSTNRIVVQSSES